MDNKNQLFETELVDGSRFRKYQKKVMYLILLFSILGVGFSIFLDDNSLSIVEMTPYYILTYGVLISSIVLYFYMNKKVPKGILKIYTDKIVVSNSKNNSYPINSIANFEIQRGATYHYSHDIGNELIKFNNFLRFNYNDINHEYEFIIDSKEKNNQFETMIQQLHKHKIKLYYTSI
ncbi:MAG: hypothetical protein P1U56_03875 [Saprospiraceae bacterium]|nr:hypothetical protein [Saprospiraceae bacterium]